MDHLSGIVEQNKKARQDEVPRAQAIVEEAIDPISSYRGRLGSFQRNHNDPDLDSQRVTLENVTASAHSCSVLSATPSGVAGKRADCQCDTDLAPCATALCAVPPHVYPRVSG